MRVISGTAGSLRLKTVSGMGTRPTSDKTKETLFNILSPYIYGSCFLDLFAGSGAIGIEALSRGAQRCIFIENNAAAAACISDNLKFTRLDDRSTIIRGNVLTGLQGIEKVCGHFDIIFMDPPYNNGYEEKVFAELAGKKYIDHSSIIVAEASAKTDFTYLDGFGFEIYKIKEYKTNKHVFIKQRSYD